MSSYIFRPGGDSKAQWTEQPVGSAWPLLNEEVTEADTPDTADNYVDVTATAQATRQTVVGPTLPRDEVIVRVEGWWYIRTAPGQSVDLDLTGSGTAAVNVPASTAYGWQSKVWTPAHSFLPELSLSISATSSGTASSSSSRIAAEFMRVITVSTFTPHRMPMG